MYWVMILFDDCDVILIVKGDDVDCVGVVYVLMVDLFFWWGNDCVINEIVYLFCGFYLVVNDLLIFVFILVFLIYLLVILVEDFLVVFFDVVLVCLMVVVMSLWNSGWVWVGWDLSLGWVWVVMKYGWVWWFNLINLVRLLLGEVLLICSLVCFRWLW